MTPEKWKVRRREYKRDYLRQRRKGHRLLHWPPASEQPRTARTRCGLRSGKEATLAKAMGDVTCAQCRRYLANPPPPPPARKVHWRAETQGYARTRCGLKKWPGRLAATREEVTCGLCLSSLRCSPPDTGTCWACKRPWKAVGT